MLQRRNIIIINIVIVLLLLLLPYYLFEGKFFIGGDDTRLFYLYPWEWVKNISFFSWFNFSSVGMHNPNQFTLPFVSLLSLLYIIIPSKIIISYFAFSLPFIIGFVYFQKVLLLAMGVGRKVEAFLGSLFFVFSPILIINQMGVFLYAVWLVAWVPFIVYYFVQYIKTGKLFFVAMGIIGSVFLSLAIFSLPWLFGFLLPMIFGVLIWMCFCKREFLKVFLRRAAFFFIGVVLSQVFWLLPFVSQFSHSQGSFGSIALSQQEINVFSDVVRSTSVSNTIIYPMTNLFHRGIVLDFHWGMLNVFKNFYDITFFLNCFFFVLLFLGIIYARSVLSKEKSILFLSILIAYGVSLFLFTVKVGFLEKVFLSFGDIPGFIMFKNFYDKFAFGYILIFSVVIAFSLYVVRGKFSKYKWFVTAALLFLIILNSLPVKDIVNTPLHTTKDISKNVRIPNEYVSFMKEVEKVVPQGSAIFSVPFGTSNYTIISGKDKMSVFAGRSPVQLFTGINDFSGTLSFPPEDAKRLETYIIKRKYDDINVFFEQYNIGYVIVTNNIPDSVSSSYLFDNDVFAVQDGYFLNAVTDERVFSSNDGNYELYKTRSKSKVISGENTIFIKISPVEYRLSLKSISGAEWINFSEKYHPDWKLRLGEFHWWDALFDKNYFLPDSAHIKTDAGMNAFLIDGAAIERGARVEAGELRGEKNTAGEEERRGFSKNPDGSIDMELTLYFKPQSYFYLGLIISGITLAGCLGYLVFVGVRRVRKRVKKLDNLESIE